MENTLNRIVVFAESQGIVISQLEADIGVSIGLIKKNIKAGSSLGSNSIENILSLYPQLNAQWLLTGTGEMLIKEIKPESAVVYKLKEEISNLKDKLIASKEKLDVVRDQLEEILLEERKNRVS